jgi:anti-sigma B factor antagonist
VDLSVSGAADGVVVVDVGGSVDVYTASELRSGLDGQIQQGHTRLVVDLQDVDFMDSTGLGVLVARLKMVRHQNGWLRLVCTNEKVLRVFRITGLDKVFSIHDSVDGALEKAPR